jgi:hypothetical protein
MTRPLFQMVSKGMSYPQAFGAEKSVDRKVESSAGFILAEGIGVSTGLFGRIHGPVGGNFQFF